MALYLYNTRTYKKQEFVPIKKGQVGIYTCGPTVYQYPHIGNMRTYIFADVLKRTLMMNGYKVRHIINITDVGHLARDEEDLGEDKVEASAKKEQKTAWEVAKFYEKAFKRYLKELNIIPADLYPRAASHIKEQINFIKRLEQKEYTYRISDGVYFDTSKFKNYGALLKKKPKETKISRRITAASEKRQPEDFALWKFSAPGSKRYLEWQSPWGIGFPGWHIECAAMSIKYLGENFDVHTGAIDHIPIHHTNEIAQAEAATGKRFVNFWIHPNWLYLDKEKMAKSIGNIITIDDLKKRGFHPFDFRYLVLTSHYRSPLYFEWKNLEAAKKNRENLIKICQKLHQIKKYGRPTSVEFKKDFIQAISDNLNTPVVFSVFWKFIDKYQLSAPRETLNNIYFADKIFGLGLQKIKPLKITQKLKKLILKREKFRKAKNFSEADKIRETINKSGFLIEDTIWGPVFIKN